MPYECYNNLYHSLRNTLDLDYECDLPDVFGALLTLTTDVMHSVKKADRPKVLAAYIEALGRTVATEEPTSAYQSKECHLFDIPDAAAAAARKHNDHIVHRLLVGDVYHEPLPPE